MIHEQSIRKLKQRLQAHFGAKLPQALIFGSVARGASRLARACRAYAVRGSRIGFVVLVKRLLRQDTQAKIFVESDT